MIQAYRLSGTFPKRESNLKAALWSDWVNTEDYIFTEQYPHRLGKIHGLDKKVVAGHVHTSSIAGDRRFNDIYYDGASHYYIDGDVLSTGDINVLMVDTDTDKYYKVTENYNIPIEPYDSEA